MECVREEEIVTETGEIAETNETTMHNSQAFATLVHNTQSFDISFN